MPAKKGSGKRDGGVLGASFRAYLGGEKKGGNLLKIQTREAWRG